MYKAVIVFLGLVLTAVMAGCASDNAVPRNTGSLYDEDYPYYDDPFYRDRYYGYPYGNRYYYYGPPPGERQESAVEEATPDSTRRTLRDLDRDRERLFNNTPPLLRQPGGLGL